MSVTGIVYVVEMKETGLVKIGSTTGCTDDVDDEIKRQTGCCISKIYVSHPTDQFLSIKAEMHRKFQIHRTYGEWFGIYFLSARTALKEIVEAGTGDKTQDTLQPGAGVRDQEAHRERQGGGAGVSDRRDPTRGDYWFETVPPGAIGRNFTEKRQTLADEILVFCLRALQADASGEELAALPRMIGFWLSLSYEGGASDGR